MIIRIQIIILNIGHSHKILGAKLFIVCIEIADLVMISLTILRLIKITIITVNLKINATNYKLIYYVSL